MPSAVLSVATIRSEAPASTALPAKQRPETIAIRGTTPGEPAPRARTRACRAPRRRRSRCRRGARRRPRRRARSAAACARSARTGGPSCDGRSRPGCRRARCSRRRGPRRRRARRSSSPLIRAVPPISPSAGVRAISSSGLAAHPLGGDREPAVLDEAARRRRGRRGSRARCARRGRGGARPPRAAPRRRSAAGARAPRRGRLERRPLPRGEDSHTLRAWDWRSPTRRSTGVAVGLRCDGRRDRRRSAPGSSREPGDEVLDGGRDGAGPGPRSTPTPTRR